MGKERLLFPVIAWYDIIVNDSEKLEIVLLFPVIAWYDIIGNEKSPCLYMFTGIFHLKKSWKIALYLSYNTLFSKNIYQVRRFIQIMKC